MNSSKIKSSVLESETAKKFFEKIKSDKKFFMIVFIAFVGVLLIMLSEFTVDTAEEVKTYREELTYSQEETENRLKELIESINGAGKVSVYITYDCAYESVYAVNSDEKTDGEDSQLKKEYIITDDDDGLILKVLYPKIRGVAVVCEGGDNPIVKEKIFSAVSALFGISTNKISVADMA